MSDKKKYFKLGEKANSFYEAVSRLTLVPGKVGSIPASAMNAQIRKAMSDGHIVEASETDFEESGKDSKKAVSVDDVTTGSNSADNQIGMTSGKDSAGKKVVADSEDEDDEDEDEDTEDDDDEDEDSDDDDEDEKPVSKEDKIKFLTESPLVKDAEKKKLGTLSGPKLNALYNTIKSK